MPTQPRVVTAIWDNEAKVFVAESEDIPGLITEAEDRDALVKKLSVLVPELLELNSDPKNPYDAKQPIELLIRFEERLTLPAAA